MTAGSNAAALRVASGIKSREEFSVVIVRESIVVIRDPKSQSVRAMGPKEFQASKTRHYGNHRRAYRRHARRIAKASREGPPKWLAITSANSRLLSASVCAAAGARASLETGLRCDAVLKGGDYECDHDLADGLGGKPTLENARILCILCHDRKTPGDQRKIAKVKRLVVKDCGVQKGRSRKFPPRRRW